MKDWGFQYVAKHKVYHRLKTDKSCILQMPTGSGKTHVAMDVIRDGLRNGKRIAFCVDRLTLLDQTLDHFIDAGFTTGVVQGNHPLKNYAAPVQVVSLQTLARRDRSQWPTADLFIIDECHTNYGIIKTLMDKWDGLKYIGLSATPFTRGLGLVWDGLVVATTTAELIEQGILADYDAFAPSQPDLTGVRQSNGDYSTTDLEERMNVLTGDIVAHYKAHGDNQKALAFTPTVAYAQSLALEFQKAGFDADHVSGYDTDERRLDVMQKYKDGRIKILCNCEVLTKGFDHPDIMVGILARPTRSLSLHIQMCGRFIREFEGKRKLILDHAGNIERLGFPDDDLPTTLDMGEPNTNSDTRDRDEPTPWNCPKCHTLVPPATRICPTCGHAAVRASGVTVEAGVLQKIERTGVDQKQAVHAMLNQIRTDMGYKNGWVSNQYKNLFGCWPHKIDKTMRMEPVPELQEYLAKKRRNFLANRHIRANYRRNR
jgi:superfamily II DNA or RNA helicase